MERYQVTLAYDGTQFLGFQRQGKGRTVQGVVETALRQLGWQERTILAAGRTDTGVHASGQVITFDLVWDHPAEALQRALNAQLPVDVSVREIRLTRSDFHPCYDAISRRYRYAIYCQPMRDPLKERYAWRVWPAPKLDRLNRAASYLLGDHDFAAYGTPPRKQGTTLRTVFQATWHESGFDLQFEITANAFLYHMVRRLVSVQVAVGQARLDLDAIPQSLQPQGKGSLVKGLAPAQGLSLVEVRYPEDGQKRESRERAPGFLQADEGTLEPEF
jgi:tRNA pseudouridine38-40 synthase